MTAIRTEVDPAATTDFVLPSASPHGAPATPQVENRAGNGLRRETAPPSRQPGTLVVETGKVQGGTAVLRREIAGLSALGIRVCALAESQQSLLQELRLAVREAGDELDATGRADVRARVADKLATIESILGWCDAVQRDLAVEAIGAAEGQQAVDLLLLCQDVVHDCGAPGADRAVAIVGSAPHTVWGNVPDLARLVQAGLQLVAARTADWGDIQITVSEDAESPCLRIHGVEGSRVEPPAEWIEDFKLAARQCGASIEPDDSGPRGQGLVLKFAPAMRGPLSG